MEKKDILLKEYLCDNVHFCDFINGVLFKGKPVLEPEKVEELPTELIFMKEVSKGKQPEKEPEIKTIHRFRDLTRKCCVHGEEVIIAIQNQSKVDFGMAVRIMTEDALDYNAQCRMKKGERLHKGDLLSPVVSVVFYHGASVWTAAKKMSELIRKMPKEMEELEQYTQQSPMLLITPWNVDVSVLQGGWREIFELLRRQNKKAAMKKYLEKHRDTCRNLPEDTKRLMFALVGRLDYYEELKQKGQVTDLCKAFDDHYKSGYRRGERKGVRKGVCLGEQKGLQQGIMAMIRLNTEQGEEREVIVNNLKKYFSLTEEAASRYVQEQIENISTII